VSLSTDNLPIILGATLLVKIGINNKNAFQENVQDFYNKKQVVNQS
jgi:hypothetical protein